MAFRRELLKLQPIRADDGSSALRAADVYFTMGACRQVEQGAGGRYVMFDEEGMYGVVTGCRGGKHRLEVTIDGGRFR